MMVQSGRFVQEIGCVQEQRIRRVYFNGWGPLEATVYVSCSGMCKRDKKYSRPYTVDADGTTAKQAIGINVLDVGEIPPDLTDTGPHLNGCYNKEKQEDREGRPHFRAEKDVQKRGRETSLNRNGKSVGLKGPADG